MFNLFYGSLALVALWFTWRDPDLRVIGWSLIVSWTVSNAIKLGDMPEDAIPGIYTMLEIIIALMAFVAWHGRHFMGPLCIVIFCIISVTSNVVYASILDKTYPAIHLHEIVTNILFALECLAATLSGAAQRGYFRDGASDISDNIAENAVNKARNS